jgi:nucleotide-binding universal stress UspA family protein
MAEQYRATQYRATEPWSRGARAATGLRPRPTGALRKAAFATEGELSRREAKERGSDNAPVVVVVGFDGTESAQRALDGAARLLQHRDGWLEVVFVAHLPATTALMPTGVGEVVGSLDELEALLGREISRRLDRTGPRWHFQRRDGDVAQELIAVADEASRRNGPQASIVLVVGGSMHKYHRLLGSVSSRLARVDRFPVVVVP